jgi:hypothetical protein
MPVSYGTALFFLYQLPLSAYQIEQAKTATIRIPRWCKSGDGENRPRSEPGTDANPATVGIRKTKRAEALEGLPGCNRRFFMGILNCGILLQQM